MKSRPSVLAEGDLIRLRRLDQQAVEGGQLLERYLADRLTDAERADFEAYCVEHPEVFDDADAITRLQDGLARLRGSGELAALLAPRRSWYRAGLALAAALLLMAVAVWFIRQQEPPVLTAASEPVSRSYQLMPTRTSAFDATISLPVHPSVVQLRLRPEGVTSGEYQVKLSAIGAGGHAQIDGVRADRGGFLNIYLHTDHIAPGIYELRLIPVTGHEAPAYLIEVRSD